MRLLRQDKNRIKRDIAEQSYGLLTGIQNFTKWISSEDRWLVKNASAIDRPIVMIQFATLFRLFQLSCIVNFRALFLRFRGGGPREIHLESSPGRGAGHRPVSDSALSPGQGPVHGTKNQCRRALRRPPAAARPLLKQREKKFNTTRNNSLLFTEHTHNCTAGRAS